MFSLYSIVNKGGDLKYIIGNLEDVFIRIAVQTTECGIFIQQYIFNTGGLFNISSSKVCSLNV